MGAGVRIGDNCRPQNYALVSETAILGEGVFVGPAAVLTNDRYPRAVTLDGAAKTRADWQAVGVTVKDGASIGARSVCVAPVNIGAWSMVAAGAVVIHDVPDFALVAGTPARWIRWVGRAGEPLEDIGGNMWRCARTGEIYVEQDGVLMAEPARAAEGTPC